MYQRMWTGTGLREYGAMALADRTAGDRALRVGFAYEGDARNPMDQSGHPEAIFRGLEARCDLVAPAFPLSVAARRLFLPLQAYARARGKVYRPDRERLFLSSLADQVRGLLEGTGVDAVFCPGSHVACELGKDYPVVFCADAPFGAMRGFYDDFANMLPRYEKLGMQADDRALAHCAAAIYPSQWAADEAIAHHGADPSKVHVMPFGANIEDPGTHAVSAMIDKRMQSDVCRILFVGRDWARKGGDLVLDAAKLLRRDGIQVEIDFMGITQPPVDLPDWARCWLADRNQPDHARARLKAFEDATLVFTPSRAEAFGMTFCEAACYGLPSVSTDVGGIGGIVVDGETGALEPVDAPAERYALRIGEIVSKHDGYLNTSLAARKRYEERLNWDAFSDGLARILCDVSGGASADAVSASGA